MNRLGIRSRVLILALLPAVAVAIALAWYFTQARLQAAELNLIQRGEALVRHLATNAEYPVVTGNRALLGRLVDHTLREQDVAYAGVFDGAGQPLVQAGSAGAAPNRPLSFRAPVVMSRADVDDLFALSAQDALPADATRQLGFAIVAMSDADLELARREAVASGLAITLALLVAAVVFALSMSGTVIRPIRAMSATVRLLGEGNLSSRVPGGAGGELGVLAGGINRMAASLEDVHTDLEARVAAATVELKAQKEAAERANLAKSKFLAAASHDLRQPMHALALFVGALRDTVVGKEPSRLVGSIESSVAALEGLLNALLDISKLDAGALVPRPRAISVEPLLLQIEGEFAVSAESKGLRLMVRPCRCRVHTDPLFLERILMNFVANAVRYTDHGGILVAARPRGEDVEVQVWDTGRGIPADKLQDIFQEFVQLENPERDRGKGLGLGLAIVDRMARMLGHAVNVRSRPGHGSMFSIRVPRASGDAQVDEVPEAPQLPQQLPAGTVIAIVDDEEEILAAMSALLTEWGLLPITANSGAALLDLLDEAPAVVLSDYRLRGGESGIAVIGKVRERFGRLTRGVLVTGDTAAETVAEIRARGFPLLFKPVRPAKLRALLSSLLSGLPP